MSAIDAIVLTAIALTLMAVPEVYKDLRARRSMEREREGIRAFEAQRKALGGGSLTND